MPGRRPEGRARWALLWPPWTVLRIPTRRPLPGLALQFAYSCSLPAQSPAVCLSACWLDCLQPVVQLNKHSGTRAPVGLVAVAPHPNCNKPRLPRFIPANKPATMCSKRRSTVQSGWAHHQPAASISSPHPHETANNSLSAEACVHLRVDPRATAYYYHLSEHPRRTCAPGRVEQTGPKLSSVSRTGGDGEPPRPGVDTRPCRLESREDVHTA
jgi:hypothetical protein